MRVWSRECELNGGLGLVHELDLDMEPVKLLGALPLLLVNG